jgi:hypothetical protein
VKPEAAETERPSAVLKMGTRDVAGAGRDSLVPGSSVNPEMADVSSSAVLEGPTEPEEVDAPIASAGAAVIDCFRVDSGRGRPEMGCVPDRPSGAAAPPHTIKPCHSAAECSSSPV